MELALNVLWLAIAITAVERWRPIFRLANVRLHPARYVRGWIALCCVLILLLPIISLTDDLRSEPVALEDSDSAQGALKSGKKAQSSSDHWKLTHTPAEIFWPAPHSPPNRILSLVVPPDPPKHRTLSVRLADSRSPPALFQF